MSVFPIVFFVSFLTALTSMVVELQYKFTIVLNYNNLTLQAYRNYLLCTLLNMPCIQAY